MGKIKELQIYKTQCCGCMRSICCGADEHPDVEGFCFGCNEATTFEKFCPECDGTNLNEDSTKCFDCQSE